MSLGPICTASPSGHYVTRFHPGRCLSGMLFSKNRFIGNKKKDGVWLIVHLCLEKDYSVHNAYVYR